MVGHGRIRFAWDCSNCGFEDLDCPDEGWQVEEEKRWGATVIVTTQSAGHNDRPDVGG